MIFNFRKKNKIKFSDEIWFVRNYMSDTFAKTTENPFQKKILLISSPDRKKCFCPVHFKWENIKKEQNFQVITEKCSLTGIKALYSAYSDRNIDWTYERSFPESKIFKSIRNNEISMEELEPSQLLKYLQEYKEYQKFLVEQEKISKNNELYRKKISQAEKIHTDIFCYRILYSNKKRCLKLEQYSFNRPMFEKIFPYVNHTIDEISFLLNSEEYDIKNDSWRTIANHGKNINQQADTFVNSMYFPPEIYEYCENLIKNSLYELLGKKITISDYSAKNKFTTAWNYYPGYSEENSYPNKTSVLGKKLQALIHFPYEPALYFAIQEFNNQDQQQDNASKNFRFDSNCYQNFCNSLGFKAPKKLRKIFLKNQSALFCYKCLLDYGFKDTNIIIWILSHDNIFGIITDNYESKKFFFQWAIPLKGEKAAWNLIGKHIDYSTPENEGPDYYNLYDSISMFRTYFKDLDYEVRRSILKDGFTRYNHDLLSNIGKKLSNKNVNFEYTAQEKSLEDEIDGYTFLLPKDYYELVNVATTLHNCAASYTQRIFEKQTLIIYAKKNDVAVLCIEVRGNIIHQQRADRNSTPLGMDSLILQKWRENHKLFFYGNNY